MLTRDRETRPTGGTAAFETRRSAPSPEEVPAVRGFRRIAGWAFDFPLPFVALGGLVAGAVLSYPLHETRIGNYVWLGALLIGGLPLVLATVRRLVHGEFASDVIATLAIVAAIALDQAFAGVIIVLMQSGGEAIEQYAYRRATSSLEHLTRRAPRWAYRQRAGVLEQIPVGAVRPGDRLVVRAGDIVPVDGTVESPGAVVDESAVTGEPLPRTRPAGESILSGSVNVGSAFDLAALRPSRESQYARIVELVRTAQTRKPTIQRLADRYAAWFTPTAIVIALLAALYTQSAVTALAVLVVATPCPLILATPIAIVRAIDRAADRGVVAKSGSAMEEMGRAQVVVFDKTGTLTEGHPAIERIVPLSRVGAAEVLLLTAALEQFSSHPLARSVGEEAHGISLPRVENVHEFPGAGVSGPSKADGWWSARARFARLKPDARLTRSGSSCSVRGPSQVASSPSS